MSTYGHGPEVAAALVAGGARGQARNDPRGVVHEQRAAHRHAMTKTWGSRQVTEFADWMRAWGASEATIESRTTLIRRLALVWPDPTRVTDEDVIAFLGSPAFGTWTRATYFGHLRSWFGWLVETGRIEDDPTRKLRRPRAPRARPRPLSPIEARRAQAAANEDVGAMLALGMLAGLRAHEAAKFHSADLTVDGLYVKGKGGHEAVLPAHPTLLSLAERRGPGFWFPGVGGQGHIESDTVSLHVSRLFASLGIEGSFHRCRHYYGTSLLRAGVNIRVVQELMRHASLATTAAYLGVDDDEKQAAILALVA